AWPCLCATPFPFPTLFRSPAQQSLDAVIERISGRQDKDGKILTSIAPSAQESHAVFVRQSQIKYADIEIRGRQSSIGLARGAHMVDGEAVALQARHTTACDQSIVCDE